MINLKIFETPRAWGNMNTNSLFFNKEYANDFAKRKAIFLENRKKAGQKLGCNPKKFYMPTQQKDGSYALLTKEMVDAYEDGWDLTIKADILMIKNDLPKVVIGYPVADCPLMIAVDSKNGVTATAHCSAEFIDFKLPKRTIDVLKSVYNSKESDLDIYFSACAGSNSYRYETYPKWAKDRSIWEETGSIKEENGIYKIDLRTAILRQLSPQAFHTFYMNPTDTITNDNYFSNYAFKHGIKEKGGRNFVGAFYIKK